MCFLFWLPWGVNNDDGAKVLLLGEDFAVVLLLLGHSAATAWRIGHTRVQFSKAQWNFSLNHYFKLKSACSPDGWLVIILRCMHLNQDLLEWVEGKCQQYLDFPPKSQWGYLIHKKRKLVLTLVTKKIYNSFTFVIKLENRKNISWIGWKL